jgi:hypothetical protein
MCGYCFEREGELVHLDEWASEYVLDEAGNRRPPMRARRLHGDWVNYDTNQGHCGLCGSLTCRGGCFK